MIEIKAQPGPQESFLSTSADIALFGGAAGGGKTFALLLEPLRHVQNPKFGAVIFRRESPQITNEGGPFDTSKDLYPHFGATCIQSPKIQWNFPSGATITFSHLQHEKHTRSFDGSQIPLICFDELAHFTASQFFYLLSRNRSTSGVKPYIRATTNPDPDSWLCQMLIDAGYVDGTTGDPVDKMSGKIMYFVRDSGVLHWNKNKTSLKKKFPGSFPKSFTFIKSSVHDNPALLEINPEYLSNLNALLDYEKKRLLQGNWFARPTAGELFKRIYFKPIEPGDYERLKIVESIRYWDRAATLPSETNPDPDYTTSVLLSRCDMGNIYIVDVTRGRYEAGDVENLIMSTIAFDDKETVAGFEQEPGASGKIEVASYENKITDRDVKVFPKTKAKLTCWKPAARAAKNGKIFIVKAPWNRGFLAEAEAVTDGSQPGHDDQVDAFAGAYNYLETSNNVAFYTVNVY